jgi:hypothetical protein
MSGREELKATMLNQRKDPRVPGHNKAAVVYISPTADPIMCTVADISKGGLGLTFVSTKGIPDVFEVEIKGEEIRRMCKVAWRQDPHRMGVQLLF